MFKPKYVAMVTRTHPERHAGCVTNITIGETTTVTDIIENVGSFYGGGRYEIRYLDIDTARLCSIQVIDIAGQPLTAQIPCNCPTRRLMTRGCNSPYHK